MDEEDYVWNIMEFLNKTSGDVNYSWFILYDILFTVIVCHRETYQDIKNRTCKKIFKSYISTKHSRIFMRFW